MGRTVNSACWHLCDKDPDRPGYAICRVNNCNKSYSLGAKVKGGMSTSTLNRHCMTKHPIEYAKALKKCEEISKAAALSSFRLRLRVNEGASTSQPGLVGFTQQTMVQSLSRAKENVDGYDYTHHKQKEFTKRIGEWIGAAGIPFNTVEHPAYLRLWQLADPRFRVPGRTKITDVVCNEIYQNLRKKVTKLLNDCHYVSFTTDMWTADKAKESFLSCTAHCMFEDFSQQCLVLNAKPYGERHDTANIARVLLTMINEYEIPSHKIHCIVADNAPVMKAAVETTRYSYLGCFAHQVQLLINKTVFIQAGVKTLNSKMHKLSGHFHSSSFATAKLKEIQK